MNIQIKEITGYQIILENKKDKIVFDIDAAKRIVLAHKFKEILENFTKKVSISKSETNAALAQLMECVKEVDNINIK